ncbi:MAG: hypothetical protein U0P30_12760 [Vicinamibacterales bacterium]|jgi:hypothetical protein
MISDLVVWSSVGLTLAFTVAWALSPALRAWIERPKHQFIDAIHAHEQGVREAAAGKESQAS